MWSAPHQPFILPVRLLDFGAIYEKEIMTSPNQASVDVTGKSQVTKAVSEALNRLARDLTDVLKKPSVKFCRISNALPDGKEGVGVYAGQLYYLIKEIKTESDTQNEDELKRQLLSHILGEGNLHIVEQKGREYF